MIIRSALMKDVHSLASLSEQLGYPLPLHIMKERLSFYQTTPGHHIMVVEENSVIFGFVAYTITELFILQGRRCFIMGLVVDKEKRGHGIGRKLMEHVEAHAGQENCLVIDLTSGKRRAPSGSHDFYRALGYGNDGAYAKLYLRKELK